MSADHVPVTVVTARTGPVRQLRDVWQYRELLLSLVRKELKVKYKNSTLGFMWSLLNPALSLFVYYVVFQVFLKSGIPAFAIFLLSGLLVWNLFSSALAAATGSVSGSAALVNKVYFPRVVLPLAAVGASLVHFFLQSLVLVGALLIGRYSVAWSYLPLLIPALIVLVVFTAAMAIFLSAVNVYARDTQHFLELLLLAWFWLTPIVYQYELVAQRVVEKGLPTWGFLVNPITPIVLVFQRALYARVDGGGGTSVSGGGALGPVLEILPAHADQLWYLRNLGFVAVLAGGGLYLALRYFGAVEGNFAEEL